MGASKSGGFTLEFQKQSYLNMERQMDNLKKKAPESAFKMLVKLLFDIKFLAQNKLKSDEHIKTSRLRNSIYVKTLGQKEANRPDNGLNYSDKDGKSYSRELEVELNSHEGAVGSNVEYAAAIEFGYPPKRITAKGKTLAYKLGVGETFSKGLFASVNWSSNLKTGKVNKTTAKSNASERWVILGKSIQHPGFKGDSFLYWGMKNVDVNKRVRETSKELLGDLTKQGRKTA